MDANRKDISAVPITTNFGETSILAKKFCGGIKFHRIQTDQWLGRIDLPRAGRSVRSTV
jgi:hypothetical protein